MGGFVLDDQSEVGTTEVKRIFCSRFRVVGELNPVNLCGKGRVGWDRVRDRVGQDRCLTATGLWHGMAHLGDVVELLPQLYLFPHDQQFFCVRVFHAGGRVVLLQCFLQWVVFGSVDSTKERKGTRGGVDRGRASAGVRCGG